MYENSLLNLITLNQPRGMPAKMAANEIRTHAPTNQRHTRAYTAKQFEGAGRICPNDL